MGSGQYLRGSVPKDHATFSFGTQSASSTQHYSHPPPTCSCPVPSPHQQHPRPSEQAPACTCPTCAHGHITHLCFPLFYINVIVLHASVRLTFLTQSVVEDFSILPCVHLACGFALVCLSLRRTPGLGPHEVLRTMPPHQVLSSPPLHPVHGTQTCPGGPRASCGDCRLGPQLSQNGCRREHSRGSQVAGRSAGELTPPLSLAPCLLQGLCPHAFLPL